MNVGTFDDETVVVSTSSIGFTASLIREASTASCYTDADIYVRLTGSAPSAGNGIKIFAGTLFEVSKWDLPYFRAIRAGVSDANLFVSYSK